MSFIEENANVKLFLLIILVAGLTVALTVVYQQNYKDITQRYHTKLNELNQTFEQLTGTQSLLNKTQEDLELKSLREEDLKSQYLIVKKRKDFLETETLQLKSDLDKATKEIQELTAKVDKLNNDLERANKKINDLETERDSLRNQVSCLRAGNANC